MKSKLTFLFNSIKQSIVNKPIAFVLLFIIFCAMTCCCSLPSRFAVSDIRDASAREASLSFDMKLKNFLKYKNNIFECFEKKEKDLNAYGKMSWGISIMQYNCDVKTNGVDNKFDSVCVVLSKFKQDEIAVKENICYVGEYDAKEYGIQEGDILQLYGIDFEVSKIRLRTSGIWIPYNTEIQNWYSFLSPPDPYTGKTIESRGFGGVRGISRRDINNLSMQLIKYGCKKDYTETFPLAGSFFVALVMLLIGMVASTTIMWYWLKCNNKKYATYKTLGCSPTMLAVTMIVETLIIALFAIGLGLFVDFILSITMKETIVIAGFEWLHYLMLIGGPFVSILIVITIAVCKRAVSMPANSKYNL